MAAAAPTTDTPIGWGVNVSHVRRALKFIKSKGAVTAEQLVEWDASHGRRLFTWDQEAAAVAWRLQEARFFLNRFRATFEGMRVRAFIHIHEDEARNIDTDAYYTVEAIAQHPGMREQVIANVEKRMLGLAGELKMWGLEEPESAALFRRLEQAMGLREFHAMRA